MKNDCRQLLSRLREYIHPSTVSQVCITVSRHDSFQRHAIKKKHVFFPSYVTEMKITGLSRTQTPMIDT